MKKKEFLQSDYSQSCGYIESVNIFENNNLIFSKLDDEIEYKKLKICDIFLKMIILNI